MSVGGNLWGSVLVKGAGCTNRIKEHVPVWQDSYSAANNGAASFLKLS